MAQERVHCKLLGRRISSWRVGNYTAISGVRLVRVHYPREGILLIEPCRYRLEARAGPLVLEARRRVFTTAVVVEPGCRRVARVVSRQALVVGEKVFLWIVFEEGG